MQFVRFNSLVTKNLILFTMILFSTAAFLLIGCSSGGGGSDDDGGAQNLNDILSGDYQFDLFAKSGTSYWNQINGTAFDGSGGYDSRIAYDSDGDSGSFSGTYTVGTDGEVTFANTDLVGLVSADGMLMAVTDTDPDVADTDISLGIAIKSGSGMSAASLNGTYIVCQIRNDGTREKASRMRFTFDGAGAVSGTILEDSDGSTGTLSGSYTVAANGELGLDITGLDKAFEGKVSSDGSLLLLLDTDDDGEVLMMVGVATGTGMDASSLSGDYQMHQFGGDATDTWTTRLEATADGAGSMSVDMLADSSDDLSSPGTMPYAVDSDGTFTITGSDNIGQLSADGEVLVLVDSDISGDGDVMLLIGIKKS